MELGCFLLVSSSFVSFVHGCLLLRMVKILLLLLLLLLYGLNTRYVIHCKCRIAKKYVVCLVLCR